MFFTLMNVFRISFVGLAKQAIQRCYFTNPNSQSRNHTVPTQINQTPYTDPPSDPPSNTASEPSSVASPVNSSAFSDHSNQQSVESENLSQQQL